MYGLNIYKSSAGSGKTFTLVLEYLKLVIANPYAYRHILAITFTNKATEEMKSRIISALEELASGNGEKLHHLLQEFYAETQPGKQIPIRDRAKHALELILGDYSNFSVSTIERFFQRVLRAFAREMNLPLSYEVEMQQDVVLRNITDQMLLKAGVDPVLTRLLETFIRSRMDSEKGWKVEREIHSLGVEIFKENFLTRAGADLDSTDRVEQTLVLAENLHRIRNTFESRLVAFSERTVAILDQYGLTERDFGGQSKGPVNYMSRFADGRTDRSLTVSPTNRAYLDTPEKFPHKDSPNLKQAEKAANEGLFDLFREMVDFFDQNYPAYISAQEVSKHIYAFGVLNELLKALAEYRREYRQLLISDTNHLLREIITEPDTPFIYEKIGNRYQHYLIDEFQDTSELQFQNLAPLLMDALARGDGGLLVGDVKQAIYRWRNGDLRLLMEGAEKFFRIHGQKTEVHPLTDNWRTAYRVVEFNNLFFKESSRLLAAEFKGPWEDFFHKAYAEVAQNPNKRNVEGFVSFRFLENNDPGAETAEEDPVIASGWIAESLQSAFELVEDLRKEGFEGKDIMFLVRYNKEARLLASWFQSKGIRVVSNESLRVSSHPHIRLLLAMLRLLHQDEDAIAWAEAIYYHHRIAGTEAISHTLFQTDGTREFTHLMESHKASLRKLPLYECVEQIMRLFPAMLSPNAYISGFLDAVLEYSGKQDSGIAGFLEWWFEVEPKRFIVNAPEADAVRIMTIHKAKGLEFPVVVIPFASWEMGPGGKGYLWIEPQREPFNDFDLVPVKSVKNLANSWFGEAYEEELAMTCLDNLNLLYVAFTRPKYRLYVMCPSVDTSKAKEVKRIQHLLNRVIPAHMGEQFVQNDKGFLECGTAQSKTEIDQLEGHSGDSGQQKVSLRPITGSLSNWNQAVRIRYSSNQFLKTGIVERSRKIFAGALLHEALSHIRVPSDIPAAVGQLFYAGTISRSEDPDLQQTLEDIISHPDARDWFSADWEIRNEADIIRSGGRLLRPDRVMIRGQQAIVVDYKSGQPDKRYHNQIRKYLEVLREMGYRDVQGFVYYIGEGAVEQVA
jgi:ATP-dependent exoDNAse (exonuclease V) beta subunit